MKHLIPILFVGLACGFSLLPAEEAGSGAPIQVAEYTFHYAKPWVSEKPVGMMRKGQLRYKQSEAGLEDIELVFFHMGGGVEANIDRWKGQFAEGAEIKIDKKTINNKEITYFSGLGTFKQSMGASGPFAGGKIEEYPDYLMLAAILPSGDGQLVFLRMTGPAKSIAAAKESFMKMVEDAVK